MEAGVIALVGAVSLMATDLVSEVAMICAGSVSWSQGRAHSLSSEDR